MAEYAVVLVVGFLGVLCGGAALMARPRPRPSDTVDLSRDDHVWATVRSPAQTLSR